MTDTDWLAQRFEAHRSHLRAVGLSDAGLGGRGGRCRPGRLVQARAVGHQRGRQPRRLADHGGCAALPRRPADAEGAEGGADWTALARAPGRGLRWRWWPDPEQEALLADSVGLAMMVVLDSLAPAERLAFVLHDVFAMPFDEIAPIVDRTPEAARQLASRARRRVRGARPESDVDIAGQRQAQIEIIAADPSAEVVGPILVDHVYAALSVDDFREWINGMPAGTRLDPKYIFWPNGRGKLARRVRTAAWFPAQSSRSVAHEPRRLARASNSAQS